MRYMTWIVIILVCWLWSDINTHSTRAVLIGKGGRLWDTSLSWISSFNKKPLMYFVLGQLAAQAVQNRWDGKPIMENGGGEWSMARAWSFLQSDEGQMIIRESMGMDPHGISSTAKLWELFNQWYNTASSEQKTNMWYSLSLYARKSDQKSTNDQEVPEEVQVPEEEQEPVIFMF